MEYLDTSYIISLAVVDDANHYEAISIEEKIEDPVASELTVIELYAYYSRNPDKQLLALFNDPVLVVESSVRYSLTRARARIVNVDLNNITGYARELAVELRLKTLDLLHVAIALSIGADAIVTFDKEIQRLGDKIYEEYGIAIIP